MNKLITPTGLGTEKTASAVDETPARRSGAGARRSGAMLRSAQVHLQKVFIVFVIVIDRHDHGTAVRRLGHAACRSPVLADGPHHTGGHEHRRGHAVRRDPPAGENRTVIGILTLPLLIYFVRDGLRQRGWWPAEHIPTWKGSLFVTISLGLFFGGVAYAYELFFPLMFNFLAGDAFKAGFTPQYSIVKWFQFVFLLAVSFGLAAQLPLVMTVLSYTEIVPYETFRAGGATQ